MNEKTAKSALTVMGVIFVLLFCLVPPGFMAAVSLADRADFLSVNAAFHFTLASYRAVLTDRSLHFLDYLRNSVIVSLASAVIGVFFASLAAYAITRLPIPGRNKLMVLVLAASMIPQISLAGLLFKMFAALGWVDTYLALVLPYTALVEPLSLWVLVSYFSRIPRELDEAALVDGCSRWQILWKIIFPVAVPGVFSVFLLAFVFSFNEFIFALMYTTSYDARTIPVGIALFEGLHGQTPWGNIMAASVISVMPVTVLVVLFQRNIIGGLTRGAVKG
jgi:multiple sugar transport system permease protein